jgi:hypothetical protein
MLRPISANSFRVLFVKTPTESSVGELTERRPLCGSQGPESRIVYFRDRANPRNTCKQKSPPSSQWNGGLLVNT